MIFGKGSAGRQYLNDPTKIGCLRSRFLGLGWYEPRSSSSLGTQTSVDAKSSERVSKSLVSWNHGLGCCRHVTFPATLDDKIRRAPRSENPDRTRSGGSVLLPKILSELRKEDRDGARWFACPCGSFRVSLHLLPQSSRLLYTRRRQSWPREPVPIFDA
jgi:hypothetical protein